MPAKKTGWPKFLIKKAEDRLIPNLTSMIEVMDAATPLTNVRYTGNYHGAISGFDRQGRQDESAGRQNTDQGSLSGRRLVPWRRIHVGHVGGP